MVAISAAVVLVAVLLAIGRNVYLLAGVTGAGASVPLRFAPPIVIAGYLLIVGRGTVGRVLGPLLVVLHVAVTWGGVALLDTLTDEFAWSRHSPEFALVTAMVDAIGSALLVAGWTVARRTSGRAWVGVAVAAVFSAIMVGLYWLGLSELLSYRSRDADAWKVMVSVLWVLLDVVPTLLIPGLIGWACDRRTPRGIPVVPAPPYAPPQYGPVPRDPFGRG